MNTIQVTNPDGQVVNYTEAEVLSAFKSRDTYKEAYELEREAIRTFRYKVRDFFGDLEWDDYNESSIHKDTVNELLESVGLDKLTSSYSATVRITVTICNIEAEDEDAARAIIEDDIEVSSNLFNVDVDDIDVQEVSPE